MGRLIDGDELLRHKTWINGPSGDSIYDVVFCDEIEEAPIVEAISKADYEARLKADLMAMLTEIQLEIEENQIIAPQDTFYDKKLDGQFNKGISKASEVIQQKIDKLKAESEG